MQAVGFAEAATRASEASEALGIRIPDSQTARAALELASAEMTPFLTNHCLRTFVWGSWAARRVGWSYDEEVAFVAAVLHDIGLMPAREVAGLSFEQSGADFVHGWAVEQPSLVARAEDIRQAIALHTTPGTHRNPIPEIAMVQLGAGVDVFGYPPYEELNPDEIDAVLHQHDRLGFNKNFRGLVAEHITRHGSPAGKGDWLIGFLAATTDQKIGPWEE